MPEPVLPSTHERQRLELLACTRLLDSEASEAFDRITSLTATFFGVPTALITLVDERRQWFKSRVGFELLETDRDASFCSHAIRCPTVMVVEDALADPRFSDNPLVLGEPRIRFYAGAPLRLASGHALGTLCVIDRQPRTFTQADCTQLERLAALVMAQVDLHQLSGRLDSVTRLPNRAQITEDLEALCSAFPGERRSLMLLDVMGHAQLQAAVRAVGVRPLEGTLRQIAAKLRSLLPCNTALYHVSETRFAFLLPEAASVDADAFVAALMNKVREPFQSGAISVELDAKAGLVDFALEPAEAADAIRRATSAMHESISQGKTHLSYGACFDAAHRRAYSLLRDVPGGLQRGEFRLVYQPKLNLRTGRYSGVEALARWQHPAFGNVSPGEFVPLIESTTLIHEFTPWVIATALAQMRQWRERGLDLTVAINVSSRNLERPGFVEALRQESARHEVAADHIHIECTEHTVMTGEATQATLKALRQWGAQVSLDDFGMGFSNLSCLTSLPVQLLKLDQSLVMPIATEPRALELVSSLIQMGHRLGYRMLAEGVESREVLELLVQADCDAAQGFHLSRPLEAPALSAFIEQRTCAADCEP